MRESRPNSAARGYGAEWRRRRAAHLERVRVRQTDEGWPGGPWCECEECREVRFARFLALRRHGQIPFDGVLSSDGQMTAADTVDHIRARRLFPLELQGSEDPGGSDHPSNLRALSHSHHSRRTEDKQRRRR